MKKVMKKMNELYLKGSDVGMVWFKTAFYYSFIPIVLYLGKKLKKNICNFIQSGLKSVDFKALINSFKGVEPPAGHM